VTAATATIADRAVMTVAPGAKDAVTVIVVRGMKDAATASPVKATTAAPRPSSRRRS